MFKPKKLAERQDGDGDGEAERRGATGKGTDTRNAAYLYKRVY